MMSSFVIEKKEHMQLCQMCSHLYFEIVAAESSAEV